MESRGRIIGKVQRKYQEEGLHLIELASGMVHEIPKGTGYEDDIKRIRKGTNIVLVYDKNDNFLSVGM